MPNTPEVAFAFGAEGDQSLLAVVKQLRTEIAGLKQQQDQLGVSAQGADRAFKGMSEGAALTTRQMREARGEAALLGEGIGIRLPRHVRNFLTELPGVANLLTAAFSVTAVLFLIDALVQLPDKIREISSSLVGWGKEAHKAYEEELKLNDAYRDAAENLERQKRHSSEAALQGAAKTRKELQNSTGDVQQLDREIAEAGANALELQRKLNPPAKTGLAYYFTEPAKDEIPKADRELWEKQLSEEKARLERLKTQREELTQVTQPRLRGAEGREGLQETVTSGKEALEQKASEENHAALLALQHQKEDLQTREAQDKAAHEAGLLSLKDYYSRRADAIRDGVRNEHAAIERERTAAQTELTGLKKLPVGPTAQDRAARLREEEAVQQRIDTLNERYYDVAQAGERSLGQLITEQNKAELDLQMKRLQMQEQLKRLQGDRFGADEVLGEIDRLRAIEAVIHGEMTEAEASAWLKSTSDARTTQTKGAQAQKTFQTGMGGLEEKRADLQEKVANHQLEPYQAARQLRQEYQEQVQALQRQVDTLKQLADAHKGTDLGDEYKLKAEEDEKSLLKLKAELDKMDASWEEWRTEAKTAIGEVGKEMTTGLNGWIQGHQRLGQAAAQEWNSIAMTAIRAIESIAAKWITTHILMAAFNKLFHQQDDGGQAASQKKIKANVKVASSEAAVAGAEEFAYALASSAGDIPYAVGKASLAYGIGMGFAGGAGFEAGGEVGRTWRAPSKSDTVPAMLKPGEHVLTDKASSALGHDTLDAFNRGDFSALQRGANLPPMRQAALYGPAGLSRIAGSTGAFKSQPASGPVSFSHTTHIDGLQALDGASVRAALEEHGDLIGDIAVGAVKGYMRQGGVNR
jgi:hypothetical protein